MASPPPPSLPPSPRGHKVPLGPVLSCPEYRTRRRLQGWKVTLTVPRDVSLTAVRITRAGAQGTRRDPREAWFWWRGAALPPLDTLPHLYARRFGIEHGYKFDKQALLWADPRLRTPAQMERWTDVVAAVHNQLTLARPLAVIAHRPWESAARSRCNRCAGRWGGLSPRLGHRSAHPDHAGNPPDGHPAPWSGVPRGTRCAARRRARPPNPTSGESANTLRGHRAGRASWPPPRGGATCLPLV